ncbi:MAG TPA: acyltransferase [Solirubrobacteraceae bacterium]
MSLDASSRERRNNFDVLRLAAATLVLVSHSFVVVGHDEPHVGHFPLGTLGVEIFFAISGFLVAKSWFTQPRLGAFALKRGLRIVPALAVTVLALAFVLGPAVSGESSSSYFGSTDTYAYPVDNVAAVASGGSVRHIAHDLPGVFTANPDTSVDRSLWTLPIEVQAYMALAILGMAGLLAGALPFMVAAFFLLSVAPGGVVDLPGIGSALEFVRGADGEASHLLAIFSLSALMYHYRAKVALRADLAVVAGIAMVVTFDTPVERWVLLVAIPYLVLFLAYRSWGGLRKLTDHADVSYGLYLLAFPVQQTIVHLWGGRPAPAVVALVAFPITYLLALGSWHAVEKRALGLKRALANRRAARVSARRTAPEPEATPVQA